MLLLPRLSYPENAPVSKLMNVYQAAEYLGCSPQVIWLWKAQGNIPFTRVGARLIRFNKDDLDAWIEKRTTRPGRGEGATENTQKNASEEA